MRNILVRPGLFPALFLLMLAGSIGRLNAEDNQLVVNGTVTDRAGQALPGMMVKAYEKKLRSLVLLAGAKTDKSGYFEAAFQSAKANPPVVIKVFGPKNELLYTSPVYYSAASMRDMKIVIKNANPLKKIPK